MSDFERFEPVETGRFEQVRNDGLDWIIVRARRNWFVIPFISVWLLGWSAGGVAAITQFISGEGRAFLAVWLVFWAVGWIFAAGWLAWQLNGSARVAVDGRALIYAWQMPMVAKVKRYDLSQVRNIRAASQSFPWSGFMDLSYPPFIQGFSGSVRFDYGGRTINLLPGLDEAEGSQIAELLQERIAALN